MGDGRSAQQSRNYKEPEETDCEAGPESFNCCHRGFSHPKKVQQQIRSADESPLHTIPKKRLSKKYRSLSKKCKPIIQILNANCRSVLNAHLQQETSVRRNTRWAGRPTARHMKRCALCHGKLGLGARFRNIWNGAWWVHVRFCSVRCEATYQDTQNNAATHRWHATLADGTSRS